MSLQESHKVNAKPSVQSSDGVNHRNSPGADNDRHSPGADNDRHRQSLLGTEKQSTPETLKMVGVTSEFGLMRRNIVQSQKSKSVFTVVLIPCAL